MPLPPPKKPDYKGLYKTLVYLSGKGVMINTRLLTELARVYNCPVPESGKTGKKGH